MPDLNTIGAGALGVYLGKDLLHKLLGPTAEYLGGELRDLAKRRIENIGRIFQSAERKLGDKIDRAGEVPPRVLKAILDEGSFVDDALAAEYFGGVLASSRIEGGRDDRGARMARLLERLSVYQIRTHYLLYSTIRNLYAKSNFSLHMSDRAKMRTFLPAENYASAMDFSPKECDQFTQIAGHVFFGLSADDLIEGAWQMGDKESLSKAFPAADSGGMICQPSALGAELYLWAFAKADEPLDFLLTGSFDHAVEGIPHLIVGAQPARK